MIREYTSRDQREVIRLLQNLGWDERYITYGKFFSGRQEQQSSAGDGPA